MVVRRCTTRSHSACRRHIRLISPAVEDTDRTEGGATARVVAVRDRIATAQDHTEAEATARVVAVRDRTATVQDRTEAEATARAVADRDRTATGQDHMEEAIVRARMAGGQGRIGAGTADGAPVVVVGTTPAVGTATGAR